MLVASREGWHPGVVGLVAARLKERFGRPAFAIAWNGGGDRHRIGPLDPGRRHRRGSPCGGGGGHPRQGRRPCHGGRGDHRPRTASRPSRLSWRSGSRRRCALPTAVNADLEIDAALSEGGATTALVEELERAGPYGNGNPAAGLCIPLAPRRIRGHRRQRARPLDPCIGRRGCAEGDRLPSSRARSLAGRCWRRAASPCTSRARSASITTAAQRARNFGCLMRPNRTGDSEKDCQRPIKTRRAVPLCDWTTQSTAPGRVPRTWLGSTPMSSRI